MTVALYPGSFDPFHLGHLDVVERAVAMFDEVVIAVLANPAKAGLLAVDERCVLVRRSTAKLPTVRCVGSTGLTVGVAWAEGADVIVRAAGKEMAAELQMSVANLAQSGLPTVFVPVGAVTRSVSSTVVRELLAAGRFDDVATLVPRAVSKELQRRTGAEAGAWSPT